MVFRDGLLSVLSLVLAVASSIVIGAFLGYSTHPDKTAAFDGAYYEMGRIGFSGTSEEIDKKWLELAQKHPGYDSPAPHATVAILKSNPLLLGALSLGFLLLFRPALAWLATVFVPATIASYFVINSTAALGVLGAMAVAVLCAIVYARFETKVAP